MTNPSALLVEDEPLLRQSLRHQLHTLWPDLDTTREAEDGVEAIKQISERMPDILFLDIQLPGLNGLEIARLVSGRCHIVFVTAFEAHAALAFEQGALDFLVKPFDSSRLSITVARLRQRLGTPPADLQAALALIAQAKQPEPIRWIQASIGNRIHLVSVQDIIYFQAEAKYTKVVTQQQEFYIRRTLKELAALLSPEAFWQIHRGTIVNVADIASITRQGEQMEVNLVSRTEKLSVSQPYQHLFKRQ